MDERLATVFIGSSSEGLTIAESLQANLEGTCECELWSQGIFGLGQGTLETLVDTLPTFDFAILVLTPDDLSEVRGETKQSARDNVLLEFGLCLGVLGRDRTFAVFDGSSQIRLPSDLAGVTLATYRPHRNGNIQASLGTSATKIKQAIQALGPRAAVSNGVFLAVPMNAFNVVGRPDDYANFQSELILLIESLRSKCGMKQIFCAAEDIRDVNEFELPGASLAIDIEKIQEHAFFIMICMRDVVSKSVLIETGMAVALGKPCVICVERGAVLPFILRDASTALGTIKKIEFETLGQLARDLCKNKGWIFKA